MTKLTDYEFRSISTTAERSVEILGPELDGTDGAREIIDVVTPREMLMIRDLLWSTSLLDAIEEARACR